MGYYTYFSMHVENASSDDIDKIVEMMKEKDIIPYAMEDDFSCSDCVKWYEEREDMTEISMAFPHVHFIVHGEGEEREDIWDHHYLNGMTQEIYAEFVMPDFDPDGWRESNYAKELRARTTELPEFNAEKQDLTLLLGATV